MNPRAGESTTERKPGVEVRRRIELVLQGPRGKRGGKTVNGKKTERGGQD